MTQKVKYKEPTEYNSRVLEYLSDRRRQSEMIQRKNDDEAKRPKHISEQVGFCQPESDNKISMQ